MIRYTSILVFTCLISPILVFAQNTVTKLDAEKALRSAVDYYSKEVSSQGGYLWRYAADFSEQEGEVPASATTVWVQSPGTPLVGMAYLNVYKLTQDPYYLEVARGTAQAMVRGQLESGGWDYRINFGENDRDHYAYRVDTPTRPSDARARNTSTLDDDNTQDALRFMMQLDRALGFNDESIHESVEYALEALLKAQYPNGAWPQRFSAPPDPDKFPIQPASYPTEWPKSYPKKDYTTYYTFNDATMTDMIDIMFMAAEIYKDTRFFEAAKRGGDFMILAQMPEPQPGWAQQYNANMHPAWARKFEPAAITGGESQGVMSVLMQVYVRTGDAKYLAPIPRALEYYKSSVLENGQLARFYELKTNKPLYFTMEYEVTYSDADMPTHYSFKTNNRLADIEAEYKRLTAPNYEWRPSHMLNPPSFPKNTESLKKQVAQIITAIDERGAWVEPAAKRKRSQIPTGAPSLSSRTFISNINTLAQFIASQSPKMITHVPTRAITSSEQPHWFGYYDKQQFDETNRYILGMRPPKEGSTPTPDDVIEVGYIDIKENDRWTSIGTSRAWNWQQGCMLQWIPGSNTIIYNDQRDGKFVSIIHDPKTGKDRILPYPIYTVSPDGKHAATLNFSRLAYTRPGYGYTGVAYTDTDNKIPEDEGVFLLNLETGQRTLLHSFKQISSVNFQEGMNGGLNWVNHLLFNTDGTRLIFLHRWREQHIWKDGKLQGRWKTRMFTVGTNGKNPTLIADHGMVSHFIWRNPTEILAWSTEPETGNRFHLYSEDNDTATVIGEGILTRDGHCTYSPDGEWILTDTYPDKNSMQQLMLYRPSDGKLIKLGEFYQSKSHRGEFRCDLHPRWSRDGKTVCIDSLHSGTRQMYILDVSNIIAEAQ